jgi:hypothetical protein
LAAGVQKEIARICLVSALSGLIRAANSQHIDLAQILEAAF